MYLLSMKPSSSCHKAARNRALTSGSTGAASRKLCLFFALSSAPGMSSASSGVEASTSRQPPYATHVRMKSANPEAVMQAGAGRVYEMPARWSRNACCLIVCV